MFEEATPDLHDTRKILDETHQYIRHNMALWVQWFTFFITINYIGLGWFAQEFVKPAGVEARDRNPLIYVSLLLISQCILGIWVSLLLRHWFLTSDKEMHLRYKKLPSLPVNPATSAPFYASAIVLGCLALVTLIVAWGFLAWKP